MKHLILSVCLLFLAGSAWGQVSITNSSPITIDFSSTITGVNNGNFDGSGFASTPSNGQLDADAWATTGMSDDSSDFGVDKTSGDFARGTSPSTFGGFYGVDIGSSDYALIIRPGGSDWTPGTLRLKINNNSGFPITEFSISYNIVVNNDQSRSNSFNFSHSTDNSTFTNVDALDYTSIAVASAGYIEVERSTTISSLNIANGDSFYLQWSGDDDSGSGSRDLFGLDDIVITPTISSTTPVVVIASASQLTSSSQEQNTDNVLLSFFDISVSDAAATLESLSIASSGDYTSDDIKTDGFKLWMDSDATFSGATQIGSSLTSAAVGSGEILEFSSLATELAEGTSYFWISADISASATVSHTLSIDAISNSDFTFTSADKSGSVSAGGTITFAAASVPLVIISETSLSDFGNTENGSTSGEESFTVSGDNLSASVTVTAPTGFEVSTTSGSDFGDSVSLTQTAGDLDGEPVTIYVRFAPVAAEGSTTADVTVSSSTDEFDSELINVSGNSLDTQPSTQASAAAMNNATASSLDISWTRGDGDNVLVLINSGSAVDSDPSDATSYTANAAFSSGTEIGTGNYVVYDGTGTSVTVTGLSSSTTYHVAVYEYNEGTGASQNYNATSAATASGTTITRDPLILSENFDYEDGTLLTTNGWTAHSGTGTNSESVVTGNLHYSLYPNSGVGNQASLVSTGEDINRSFDAVSNNTIYYSALINVTSAQSSGDYFMVLMKSTSSFFGRLYAKSSNDGFVLGVGKGSTAATYDATELTLGKTYLVVMAYTFNTETSDDDDVKLWINPDLSGIEPTPTVTHSTSDTDASYIEYIALRQGNASNAPALYIDGIRVTTDWETLTQPYSSTVDGTAGYRMLSSPISGFTVSDISDNTAIQGISGGDFETDTANFYYFGSTGLWATPTDVNTAFGDGYGFIVKFFNNTEAGSSELPITLDVTGSEPSEDVVVSLNKTISVSNEESTVYYTLLGNPFASNLDLSSLSVNNSGSISANAIIWDNSTSDYATVSTETGVLAPWQGFWAFVLFEDDATQVTIPTSGKTSSDTSATYFRKQAATPIEGLFTLTHGEVTSQPFKVFLHDDAKMGFDIYDVSKLTPLSESYAVIGGRQVSNSSLKAIESLPMDLNEVVELAIEPQIVGNSGEFTINWKQFSQFPVAFTIELHDSQTGETYDLRNDGMLTFSIEAPLKVANKSHDLILSGGSDRFKVVITPITTSVELGNALPTSVELSQNFPNPFNPSTTIQYAVPAQSTVRLAVYDMLGREVAVLVNGTKAAGNYEFAFDASSLSSGMYIYRLEAAGTVMTRKMTLIK